MKVTHNIMLDLKEEIEKLQNEIGKLSLFKDDHEEMMKALKIKLMKENIEALNHAQIEA